MKMKKILFVPLLCGLFLLPNCGGGEEPVGDLTSMALEAIDKSCAYSGPLTIKTTVIQSDGINSVTDVDTIAFDQENYRYYEVRENSGDSNVSAAFTASDGSKGKYYYYRDGDTPYISIESYSHRNRVNYFGFFIDDTLHFKDFFKSENKEETTKEIATYYAYIYFPNYKPGLSLVSASGYYSKSIDYPGAYEYRINALVKKEGEAELTLEYSHVFTSEYMIAYYGGYSVTVKDGETTSTMSMYQKEEFNLSFDENKYNEVLTDLTSKEISYTYTSLNYVNYMYKGTNLTQDSVNPNAVVDFAAAKSRLEDRYQIKVKDMYFDEELQTPVTDNYISEKYYDYVYLDLEVNEGFTILRSEKRYNRVTLPDDPITTRALEVMNGYKAMHELYYGFDVVALNTTVTLPWNNIYNYHKINYVKLDGQDCNQLQATFTEGEEHVFSLSCDQFVMQGGDKMRYARPLLEDGSYNTENGLLIRACGNTGSGYPYIKIDVKDIAKENFELKVTQYQSDHLLNEANLSTATEVSDTSELECKFYLEGSDTPVTSIPEGYEGNLYIYLVYWGEYMFHYVLIG